MTKRLRLSVFFFSLFLCMALGFGPRARAQQTLGSINGAVTDTSGGAITSTSVTLVSDATKLTRTTATGEFGSYDFVNLPIGSYTLTFSHDGFESQKVPSIIVQANRTTTLNVSLKVGQVSSQVTVEASPLLNAADTTNGYILEKNLIESAPLPTGSFTGLAILSPGVNAELPGGTGVNSGLGNVPIWANGQRDTSNSFLLNGVDASNLFNGKSTSQVASSRVVLNTGISTSSTASALEVQSSASPYLAIGQAIPTPAPDSIQELRVNTSMYDAQQGSSSGAHIDMSTSSGTNDFHGSAYVNRGTNALNAAPFFYKADPNIPAALKNPDLHRVIAGGTFGGPLIKNKLFGYISYQHVHTSDQQIGLSRTTVPAGLTNDRSAAALAAVVNNDPATGTDHCTNLSAQQVPCNFPSSLIVNPTVGSAAGDINPIAFALLNFKLPNGQYLFPSADGSTPSFNFPENAIVPGTALFLAHQGVANLDWNATAKDTVAIKYYYQHDPTIAPYAYSSLAGFNQHLDAGSQVFSISNTQTLSPNFSVNETFGFLREKVYSTISQPFSPSDFGINTFGSKIFPGITLTDDFGNSAPYNTNFVSNLALNIGQSGASQGAFTGVFQNRFMPSANAIWTRGKHALTFGGSYAYTQLNTRDQRTNQGIIGSVDFSQFLQGLVTPYTSDGFITTAYLQGDANRYMRAGQSGLYVQDRYQIRSNLSVTLGLRWDWNGGFTEKYGRIYNFDPSQYSFDETSGAIKSSGFIVAGNNKKFPSPGVSDTTLTGRQWGIAPRFGLAWSPSRFHNKIVVRAGSGLYYDRGELYSYLSPGFAAGVIAGGPFGFNQAPPFVNSQVCTATLITFYLGFVPTCDPSNPKGGSLANPWGTSLQAPPSGNPADILNFLPSRAAIEAISPLFSFAVYNRKNKLPYTINNTLDIQWQPTNDLAIQIGYVGNLGRHGVIPLPFNQSQIASPSHPIHGQIYTYGYTILDPNTFSAIALPNSPVDGSPQGNYLGTFEGGNVDLRVPFVGYSSESESYTAAGISAYHALQTHVEKRMSHGLRFGFSYTYSHATDEQSGLGLFFNGNNPLNLRSAYGSSDFDRTHVFNFSFVYELPKFVHNESSLLARFTNGWAFEDLGIYQSGQPYSIIDFSGAVGSINYGTADGITNPIVPLGNGCTPGSATTGHTGVNGQVDPSQVAVLAKCFTVPLLTPGSLNGAIPSNDPYETGYTTGQRNIFRQSWQKRMDVSFVKNTKLTERFALKFNFQIFNVTNTPSFDIPIDDVTQNAGFNGFPVQINPNGPTQALPTSCDSSNKGFYNCPFGLGFVNKTIGGPRQIQMALHLTF